MNTDSDRQGGGYRCLSVAALPGGGLRGGTGALGLVVVDDFLGGAAAEGGFEGGEGEVVEGFEADAALAHVELLARGAPGGLELFAGGGVEVEGHEVDGEVVFLRGQGGDGQRLARVAVIAGGVDGVGDEVADHAVLDPLGDVRFEAVSEEVADLGEHGASVGWEGGEVVVGGGVGGLGGGGHLSEVSTGLTNRHAIWGKLRGHGGGGVGSGGRAGAVWAV